MKPSYVQVTPDPLCITLWELGNRKVSTNAYTLATVIAVSSNISYFWLRSSCLLQASLQLQQDTSSACGA